MLNAAFGLQQLNQSWATPARISQGQKGLFDQLGEALNPTPQIDVQDPSTIRQAAQHAMNKGDTVKGSELMEQARQVEGQREQERIKNIRRTYQQAVSAGKGEQFKKAMIEAGYADTIANVEKETMQAKVAEATGNATLDRAAVEKSKQSYYSATTEEGKKAVLESLIADGRGDVAREIQAEEADAAWKQSERDYKVAAIEREKAEKAVRSMRIPNDPQQVSEMIQNGDVPPEHQDLFLQRANAVFQHRARVQEIMQKEKSKEDLPEDIITGAGMTMEYYKDNKDKWPGGPAAFNQRVLKQSAAVAKQKEPTTKTASASQAKALIGPTRQALKEINNDWFLPDEDDPEVMEIAVDAANIMENSKEPMTVAEAMELAIAKKREPEAVEVASEEAARNLPKGTKFVLPDGRTGYVK